MKPFKTVSEAIAWWKLNARSHRCSVLIDNRDIGLTIQRRTVHRIDGSWVFGFAYEPTS